MRTLSSNLSFPSYSKCKSIFIENYLLIAFAIVIIIALSYPIPGEYIGSYKIRKKKTLSQLINTFFVFLISGLTLKTEEFHNLQEYSKSIALGIFSINFLTTLLAPLFLSCNFLSFYFRLGLAIFSCVPTTLGVGVALTQLSKGDSLLALLLTVLTNILGTVTTPFLLILYLSKISYAHNSSSSSSSPSSFHFDSIGLLIDLSYDVFLPTVIGICLRFFLPKFFIPFTKNYKTELSLFSTTNLAMIIWVALSKSRDILIQQNIGDLFIVLFCAILQHVFYLVFNFILSSFFKFPMKQTVALIIMCSQKSNPVALAVINGMGLNGKESGLVIIPGILGQISQIFIGSLVARYLQTWHEQAKQTIQSQDDQGSYKECEKDEQRVEEDQMINATTEELKGFELSLRIEPENEIEV